jgi:hypothetical protein
MDVVRSSQSGRNQIVDLVSAGLADRDSVFVEYFSPERDRHSLVLGV